MPAHFSAQARYPFIFALSPDSLRHERIHAGVKPHICPRCNKGFLRKDALKRHIGTAEGVQYKCSPYMQPSSGGMQPVPSIGSPTSPTVSSSPLLHDVQNMVAHPTHNLME